MPQFSIIIVNYNYGHYLEQAIMSVLAQTYKDFELIIVDGSSSDCSIHIIKKYTDQLAWWVSEPDKGQSDAFNKGFAKAKGEYYLWLNADDLIFPDTLETASRYLRRHPDCSWLAGDTVCFNVSGTIQRCLYGPYYNTWLMKQTRVCGIVNGPSSIFSRYLYEKVGGVDTALHYVMDMNLWMKFVDHGVRLHKIHKYFWGLRIHEESKTSHEDINFPDEDFKKERDMVIKKNQRIRTVSELFWFRMWKLFTGTHLRGIYDTWKWRGLPIDLLMKKISAPKH